MDIDLIQSLDSFSPRHLVCLKFLDHQILNRLSQSSYRLHCLLITVRLLLLGAENLQILLPCNFIDFTISPFSQNANNLVFAPSIRIILLLLFFRFYLDRLDFKILVRRIFLFFIKKINLNHLVAFVILLDLFWRDLLLKLFYATFGIQDQMTCMVSEAAIVLFAGGGRLFL